MLISEHLLRALASHCVRSRGKIPKSPEPMVRGGAALGPLLDTTKRNFVNSLSPAFTNTGLQGHFGGRTKELVVANMG
jgi:hypothetical protein